MSSNAANAYSTPYLVFFGVSDITQGNSFTRNTDEDWRLAAPLVLPKNTFPKHALGSDGTR